MKEPDKTLTIHLYRKEEVLAALPWAIISKNYTESIYWGLELFDSDLMSDALDVLVKTWVTAFGYGPNCFAFLEEIVGLQGANEYSRDDWIQYLYTWSQIKHIDSTAFQLLIRGSTISTDWKPIFEHSKEYSTIQEAFCNCLERGKLEQAWLISRALDPQEIWKFLDQHSENSGRAAAVKLVKELNLLEREKAASAMTLATLTEEVWTAANVKLKPKQIPSELLKMIDEWDSEESMRKRRVYSIRPEAITYICERSSIPSKKSTDADIKANLESLLLQSSYWQLVLEDYMSDSAWKSDRYREMFYDTYFPYAYDDIPDEWSAADREKSHGLGLGKTYTVALRQYINAILQRSQSVGIWNSISSAPDNLPISLEWDIIYKSIHLHCSEALVSMLPLKPLKKMWVVV
jgi:hypothetical protein